MYSNYMLYITPTRCLTNLKVGVETCGSQGLLLLNLPSHSAGVHLGSGQYRWHRSPQLLFDRQFGTVIPGVSVVPGSSAVLARMLPQNWADEFIRDWTPQVVTEVGGGRLAVVLAELAHATTHSPQSLRISGRQRQLRRCHGRHVTHVRLGVWERHNLVTAPVYHGSTGKVGDAIPGWNEGNFHVGR